MDELNYKIFNIGLIHFTVFAALFLVCLLFSFWFSSLEQLGFIGLSVIMLLNMSIGLAEMIKRRKKIANLKEIIPSVKSLEIFLEKLSDVIAHNDTEKYDELFLYKEVPNSKYNNIGKNASAALYQLGFKSEQLFGVWYEIPFEAISFVEHLKKIIKEYKKPYKRLPQRIFNEIV